MVLPYEWYLQECLRHLPPNLHDPVTMFSARSANGSAHPGGYHREGANVVDFPQSFLTVLRQDGIQVHQGSKLVEQFDDNCIPYRRSVSCLVLIVVRVIDIPMPREDMMYGILLQQFGPNRRIVGKRNIRIIHQA